MSDDVLFLLASRLPRRDQARFRVMAKELEDEGVDEAGSEAAVGGGRDALESLFSVREREEARKEIDGWKARGYGVLAIGDRRYPPLLKESFEPPLILFYAGALPERWESLLLLSIVGTRRPDATGIEIARFFASACAELGICVVSGLAMGVDTAAHEGALPGTAACPTIAVLGSGLDTQYPAVNRHLYQKIVQGGGVLLTQYEPHEKPLPARFLERNRIIAGISKGVLVIQAGQRSGSLVTARYALEEGRDVMVVPGGIQDPRFYGSNALIREGAYLVRSPDDIVDALGIAPRGPSKETDAVSKVPFSDVQRKIIEMLGAFENCHYDKLASASDSRSAFANEMLQLELLGIVSRRPGNYFSLAMRAR